MKTELQTRIDLYEQKQARELLETCPWLLAEKVASHYASTARLAMTLHQLTETAQRSTRNESLIALQSYILGMIWESHVDTFGMPPNWPITPEQFEHFQEQLTKGQDEIH